MNSRQTNHQLRRVVITGMGTICPLGSTPDQLWESLEAGQSGVSILDVPGSDGLPVRFAAQANQFTGKIDCFGSLDQERKKAIRKGLKVMCRECQMGVAVAQLALEHAQVEPGSHEPDRTGISFGVDYMLSVPEEFIGGIRASLDENDCFEFAQWPVSGMPQMSPLWLLKYLPNMPASHLAIYNDFRGPNNSITLREAAANQAVGEAARMIAEGRADRMLSGATGTRLHSMKMIHCIQQAELASPEANPAKASRPFDAQRTGMVLGEGAGALVLEDLELAKSRGATIHGEVLGAASTAAIGPRLTAQPREALVNAIQTALADAGLAPDEIGHVHAHGLGTKTSDVEEAQAIHEVFGSRQSPVPVVTAKGHIGNLGAGSGMIELIASVLSLRHDRLFSVLNYQTPDPECPIQVVNGKSYQPGDNFINLSITPQGQASAVVIGRPPA